MKQSICKIYYNLNNKYMANKIATEKEAAEKGGISGNNSKRLVKYEKLETFGCTTESVKANNRLVPVNELLELKP